MDDLESLLYSPVSLKFNITDDDVPNILEEAKGRAAANKLHKLARQSDTDTDISEAVKWSLVKGKSLVKMNWKRKSFSPELVQPECFGVFRDNHKKLDEDMEAFVHSQLITPYQFQRIIRNHPNRDLLMRRAKNYQKTGRGEMGADQGAMRQIITGGLYPFQPGAGSGSSTTSRNIVDWLGGASPMMTTNQVRALLQLDEVWIWDDDRDGWATFQLIGDDMLIWPVYQTVNLMAYNPESKREIEDLKAQHPFTEFCPNKIDGNFWGRSEIINVALLQEAINSRVNGLNKLLRKQEDPPHKFIGGSGVNQNALARFSKPGGYWVDSSPNAKVEAEPPQISADMWASLHEYERMFDEMGGLPPIAKGRGEAGVRSQGHAETLVRMFSPRFKDRALLVERSVEALGALMLDLARVHVDKKLIAWVNKEEAAGQAAREDPLLRPPSKGLVPVFFSFDDLDDDVSVTVDSHSASPAFQSEARALVFDLFKIGAMTAVDVVEHVDVSDPEGIVAGIERREAQKAEQIQALTAKGEEKEAMKLIGGGKKRH